MQFTDKQLETIKNQLITSRVRIDNEISACAKRLSKSRNKLKVVDVLYELKQESIDIDDALNAFTTQNQPKNETTPPHPVHTPIPPVHLPYTTTGE